jgi:hypothetical protein
MVSRVAKGGPALLHALQRSAGNAAVAQAVQRYGEPPAPVGLAPSADPKFVAMKGQIAGKSKTLKAHPSPKSEAKKASDAAVAPGDDKEAQAKAAQAEAMSGAKPVGFDKAGFIAAVKAAIAAQAPKNLDEADNFGESGKADAVKGQVVGKVKEGKDRSAKDIADKTSATPDPSKAVEKPVTPLAAERPPAPAPIDAAAGMPSKAPAEETDFSGGKQETDQKMAEAEVTEEQLVNSNEPEFAGAVAAKKEGEQHSATAPAAVRESEAAKLGEVKAGAASVGKAGLAGMLQAKGASRSKAATGKAAAKAKDEAARADIALKIKGIFDTTKVAVDAILSGLDAEVAKRFDAGEKIARDAFTADHKARMEAYKDDRYSGLLGKGRWVRDKFAGLPEAANKIYLEAKKLYESKMEQVISNVADFIGGELTKAKDRIALGRSQIKDFVAKQPKDLQKVANQTAEQFADQFDQLESDVDSKKDSLVDDLANKYVESRNAVDEEIKAAQEENKGLWDKVKDAIGGAIQTILKLKDMLLGVLARAASAIGKIIKDPIGFLGNLVTAVKSGVMNFAANIVDHLKKGLQAWLLGSLAESGIELPEKFDLKGIIKLVLSILGLTWANIRSRIVKVIPESVMDKVEKGVAFIQMVVTEGIGGLWKWVAEKLSDLKEMVMGQIRDFVITKIIKAGITWVISLLNPAAAFINACKMIYDVVMFFVEKAEQIKEFVDSILDSVDSIASGGVGAVAGYIEKTLAKTLPLVLGFLASLLGLGGISDKIKDILHTIQKPVMSVVDKLVAGAVKYGKKLMAGAKKLGKKALGKVKAGASKLLGKVKVAKGLTMKGNSHRLFVEARGNRLIVEMASGRRELLSVKIQRALGYPAVKGDPTAEPALREALARLDAHPAELDNAKWTNSTEEHNKAQVAVEQETTRIAMMLQAVGVDLDIKELRESIWVLAGEVHPQWIAAGIRETFYKGFSGKANKHRESERSRLMSMKLAAKDQWLRREPRTFMSGTSYLCPGHGRPPHLADPQLSSDWVLTLDHKESVAQHWNRLGHNSGQDERVKYLSEIDNLTGLCRSCNSRKGGKGDAEESERGFNRKVGTAFKGPDGT